MSARSRHENGLAALDARDRRRRLIPRAGRDFASNDYLGLCDAPLMRAAAQSALERGMPLGSGGSRLLRGNHSEHQALETEAALFFGTEAALFMGGGFQANMALFSTLPGAGDLVLHDALIHASTHDGMRLGRAQTRSFGHNDVAAARDAITTWRAEGGDGQIWLAIESVYSMEGTLAPMRDFAALARDTGSILVVDEAHATGVFGPEGRGLAHEAEGVELLTLHTCGKGLGVSGALICGAQVFIDTLINRARPFIFATAPSPFDAAMVRAALSALHTAPALRDAAQDRILHAQAEAHRLCGLDGFESQIMPVIIGKDGPTMARAADLQAQGFDLRGIRPPTVPRNTSRLRISLTGNIDKSDITALFEAIARQEEPRK